MTNLGRNVFSLRVLKWTTERKRPKPQKYNVENRVVILTQHFAIFTTYVGGFFFFYSFPKLFFLQIYDSNVKVYNGIIFSFHIFGVEKTDKIEIWFCCILVQWNLISIIYVWGEKNMCNINKILLKKYTMELYFHHIIFSHTIYNETSFYYILLQYKTKLCFYCNFFLLQIYAPERKILLYTYTMKSISISLFDKQLTKW